MVDANNGGRSGAVTTRRDFGRGLFGVGVLAASAPLTACDTYEVDYIVIGSGAGGGPLAANLAKAGYTVAVLEAGIDVKSEEAQAVDPNAPIFYQIPAFLAVCGEHPLFSWDFYVRHFDDPTREARDSKYVPGKGFLYPRGSTLGGSTAHNAMVFTYPHDRDFDLIADMTGDESWRAENMRPYFQRLERCEYLEPGAPGHGFDGYMSSSVFDPKTFELYPALKDIATARESLPSSYEQGNTTLDVNHPLVALGDTGSFRTPMHTSQNARVSVREYLVATQQQHPDRLYLVTGALATKILIHSKKAYGVEFIRGANLYAADKAHNPAESGESVRIHARKEVIVCGGAFNTPQLLKLSGIGPKEELKKFKIPLVADLPGVGRNLQDRYEMSVMLDLKEPLELLSVCRPGQAQDPCGAAYFTGEWEPPTQNPFYGPYANNAIFSTRIVKSQQAAEDLPDLFMVGFAIPFRGFYPGFSQVELGKSWTWLVLKCHNENTAGTVKLRSPNPRDTPEIHFRYYDDGNDAAGKDLEAMVEAVKELRSYAAEPSAAQHIASEALPGPDVATDDELREYIRHESWGHHASCSARIGGDGDPMAVLDSRFRVRGVKNLRVVDACVFPRIPGFFPVAAVLMISEKASDVILEDA